MLLFRFKRVQVQLKAAEYDTNKIMSQILQSDRIQIAYAFVVIVKGIFYSVFFLFEQIENDFV